jgi:hypothetical protein
MKFARRAQRKQPQLSALEQMEAAENHLVAVPWKGSPCIVKARELSDLEIQAIGNFSLIETEEFKWSKGAQTKVSWGELLSYANKNVAICRDALISPTYDEIFNLVGNRAFNNDVRGRIKEINVQLREMVNGPARQELEAIRDSILMAWDIILPEDFMTGVVAYAIGIHRTDIKKVTEDMLYSAMVLAIAHHKAAHDYIHGVFSDFNIRDIDTQAMIIYETRMQELREKAKRGQE